MFVHNLDPVLFSLFNGLIQVRYYGLVYALGFLFVYYILIRSAKNNLIENLTDELADKLVFYLILGVLLGGRLGHVLFYNFSYFVKNPLEIFMLWYGGMAFHGALIAVSIITYYFCKKYKIKFLQIADILSAPVAFVLFLGRIANFINAELIGTVMRSQRWFCIDYSKYGAIGCRHPSQFYEALKNLFIFGFVIFEKNYLLEKFNLVKDGVVFYTFVTLYGLLRFLTNFYRDDVRVFLGLSTGQIFSLLMFFVGMYLLYKTLRTE
jgi:phosphatidylglycerol:prolipoprotein diacylglycerol transferase